MRFQSRWNWVVTVQAAVLSLFLIFSSTSFAQANPDNQAAANSERVNSKLEDYSKWPGFLLALQGGGGWFSQPGTSPTAYGGFKIGGGGFVLDLGYDHVRPHDGVSVEASGLLPVVRFPRPQRDEPKNYLRVFAQPGMGYRGPGGIGGYLSAKMMLVLFSDLRLTSSSTKFSPYIEAQRRIPFNAPSQGDNRISFGLMFAICEHCGID
ncbi:MAG TPA: hypothetical protein VG759_06045 [Candidatus Angelobacter sp.]|jgi:hypothetical protein|nr:hypothetical protein [Candidatus Angelobacter sp.]